MGSLNSVWCLAGASSTQSTQQSIVLRAPSKRGCEWLGFKLLEKGNVVEREEGVDKFKHHSLIR